MNKTRSMILGAAVAFATIGLAHADPASVTGTWKLSTGVADDPCTVTLTADADGGAGSAVSAGDCNGTNVTHWRSVGTSLQLLSTNNELVAWLKPDGDAYKGKRIEDGRVVALNR
jgi:hypothetical protein